MAGAGHAEDAPDDHGDEGHRGLVKGSQRMDAAPDRPRALGVHSDHETGLVDEMDDGQVEGVREVDEASQLV